MPLAYLSSFPLRIFIGKALHCGVIFVNLLQKLQNVFQSKSLVFFVHLVKVTTLNVKSTLMKAVFQQTGTFHSSSVFITLIVVVFVSSLFFVCLYMKTTTLVIVSWILLLRD